MTDVIRWVTCDAGPAHPPPAPTAGLITRLLPLMAACLHRLWCCRLSSLSPFCPDAFTMYLHFELLSRGAQSKSNSTWNVVSPTTEHTGWKTVVAKTPELLKHVTKKWLFERKKKSWGRKHTEVDLVLAPIARGPGPQTSGLLLLRHHLPWWHSWVTVGKETEV